MSCAVCRAKLGHLFQIIVPRSCTLTAKDIELSRRRKKPETAVTDGYNCNRPSYCSESLGSCRLVLSQAEMTSFFQPSLDKVIATAQKMLDYVGSVDNILLVGGFSSSRFAMRTLRAALEAPGRSVITPVYNRTAVLEGWYLFIACRSMRSIAWHAPGVPEASAFTPALAKLTRIRLIAVQMPMAPSCSAACTYARLDA